MWAENQHPANQSRDSARAAYVSTGRLPPAERVQALVEEAHERFKSSDEGKNADHYPALAAVSRNLFGVCVVGNDGAIYAAGDAKRPFTIMSVSKPFVFGLVCQALGAFAPPLDGAGNSVKGQLAARFLSERLGLNLFASTPAERAAL
jgi:glutaminase